MAQEPIAHFASGDLVATLFTMQEGHHVHRKRSADRLPVRVEVRLRCPGGNGFRVRLFDASPAGCKTEFVERPKPGDRVWMKFDGLDAVEGSIRWLEGAYGGVQFDRPMHPAVFNRIAR